MGGGLSRQAGHAVKRTPAMADSKKMTSLRLALVMSRPHDPLGVIPVPIIEVERAGGGVLLVTVMSEDRAAAREILVRARALAHHSRAEAMRGSLWNWQ